VSLYNHGRGSPTDKTDEQYRRGLLLGCLSNATIQKAHFIFDFPRELIGNDELERILVESEYGLGETLVRNPEVSDQLLEQLYKREGVFANIPDQRLAHLVHSSRENERINTNNDDDYSPDLGTTAFRMRSYSLSKPRHQLRFGKRFSLIFSTL
jgi:hypothetical protein